jgi:hypothetical protein
MKPGILSYLLIKLIQRMPMENKIHRATLNKMITFILKSSKDSRGTFITNWKEEEMAIITRGMSLHS